MILMLLAIFDFSRIYTTMMSVESAAREAADFGTTLGAERWSASNAANTVAEMKRRACVAASDLPDYEGVDVAPADGVDEDCSNPTFDWCMTWDGSLPCDKAYPVSPATENCDNPDRDPPCTLTVTLTHEFHLFVPFQLDFFGVELGLPVSISFDRDSTYAMTDIEVAGTPTPAPTPTPTP